jgi:hypothetical protein
MEIRFEVGIFGSDTMLNHYLSQKLNLIENGKFNHLINILSTIGFSMSDDSPFEGLNC